MNNYQTIQDANQKVLKIPISQWRNIFSIMAGLCLAVLVITFIVSYNFKIVTYTQVIYIEKDTPAIFTTDEKFLSIALDTSLIAEGLDHFNFSSKKFIKMFEYLQPAYFRIGGTMADRLHFVPNASRTHLNSYEAQQDGGSCAYNQYCCNCEQRLNFTMTGGDWFLLNKLARKANLKVVFDLNALIRNKNGSWHYKNAEELIKFSNKFGLEVNWELGNEPNAFLHQFDYAVNATQMAKDFKTLREILKKHPLYEKSLLVGPDVTRPRPTHKESERYLRKFLRHGKSAVDAITWHQYYFNGRTANAEDFVDTNILDLLKQQITTVKEICKEENADDKPIWLGETSSCYGGGAPGLSDRYIAMFMWADKLGLAAKMGLKVVIRQSIIGGDYALLHDDYSPNPDWWFSVLYKRLVGPIVVESYTMTHSSVRLYTHCTAQKFLYFNTSSITVFGINVGSEDASVRIEGLDDLIDEHSKIVHVYDLNTNFLYSRYVLLNGNVLRLTDNYELPPFHPKISNLKPEMVLPAYSVVFWVIPDVDVKACSEI